MFVAETKELVTVLSHSLCWLTYGNNLMYCGKYIMHLSGIRLSVSYCFHWAQYNFYQGVWPEHPVITLKTIKSYERMLHKRSLVVHLFSMSSDPMHTYLGLCGLSLNGEPGLRPLYPALNLSQRAADWLHELQNRR